jgi:predicted nuclease of predicted toxin-antitoxin system
MLLAQICLHILLYRIEPVIDGEAKVVIVQLDQRCAQLSCTAQSSSKLVSLNIASKSRDNVRINITKQVKNINLQYSRNWYRTFLKFVLYDNKNI